MKRRELDWLEKVVYPDIRQEFDRKLLQAAAAEVQTTDETGELTPKVIDALRSGLQSRSTIVTSSCSRWLFRYAADHAAALDCLMDLLHHGKSGAREAIIRCVGFNDKTNVPLEERVLRNALRDSSTKLQTLAVERIQSAGWNEMLPDVEAAAKDPKLAAAISDLVQMMREGFKVDPCPPDEPRQVFTVSVGRLGLLHSPHGWTGVRVPNSVIPNIGEREIARRIRVRSEWPGQPSCKYPGEMWDPVPDPDRPNDAAGFDPILVAARAAFANYQRTGEVTKNVVDQVSAALHATEKSTVKSGAFWTVFLATNSREVAESLVASFPIFSNEARHSLLYAASVEKTLPDAIFCDMLRQALTDPDPGLRWSAGLDAQYGDFKVLVPELENALAREYDAETRERLAGNILYLTVGYKVTSFNNKKVQINVANGVGTIEVQVPKKVVDEFGPAEIADRIRRRHNWLGRRPKGNAWDPV